MQEVSSEISQAALAALEDVRSGAVKGGKRKPTILPGPHYSSRVSSSAKKMAANSRRQNRPKKNGQPGKPKIRGKH